MKPLIRLAVFAGAVLAIAPVASAQCIVDPNAVGTPCVGGTTGGSPPVVRGQRPVVRDIKPARKVAPIKPIPPPSQPAKPGNLINPPGLAPSPALKP